MRPERVVGCPMGRRHFRESIDVSEPSQAGPTHTRDPGPAVAPRSAPEVAPAPTPEPEPDSPEGEEDTVDLSPVTPTKPKKRKKRKTKAKAKAKE